MTHTHQAWAPTDQHAPITPIGAVAYLANLDRAADQIGGYLRVRWRAWWLRCDDHGRERLGRTAARRPWLGQDAHRHRPRTSPAARAVSGAVAVAPCLAISFRAGTGGHPAATSAITSSTKITGPKVGMRHRASAARQIRCQMHTWTRKRPRPPPPTATLAPAGARRRTFTLPRGHLTRRARCPGKAPSRRSRSSGDHVRFRSAVSSDQSPARPASARRADRPG